MTRIVLRSIARFFRRLTRAPATLYDRWDADSEMPSGVTITEDPMDIPFRALLTRALADLTDSAPYFPEAHKSDTVRLLKRFLAQQKPGDTVAVELPIEAARALRRFIASPYSELADVLDEGDRETSWEQIDDALRDAILAYDGPDGDDGRDFVNAKGEPFYEP